MLGRLFAGLRGAWKGKAAVAALPSEVQAHLAEKDFRALQLWLQQVMGKSAEAPEFPLLLRRARELGWPDKDIERLEVFGCYFSGNLQRAYEVARKYAEGGQFTPDLFVIAVYAIYRLGQYEEAYGLLVSAHGREADLSGRADYALVAALTCSAAGRLNEAGPFINAMWRLAPGDPVVALNAYAMSFELGDLRLFEQVRQEIRGGRYPLDRTGFSLAVVELAQDNYPEGFRLLEARYDMEESYRYLNQGLFDRPRWQGEPLAGKTLLVSAEQGLGDTVQMVRYLPELARLGARRVVMETQPETLSLLQFNFPDVEMVVREYAKAPPLAFDFWVGAMSLPHSFGTDVDTVPASAGYLRVPTENAAYWRSRIGELASRGQLRIGLAWSGEPTHRADRRRSVGFERMVAAIVGIEADFFALQLKVPDTRPHNLIDVSEELLTLADTAALIAEMDAVITVDTSVVHVAGALGKLTWLLLPYRYEWRWSLGGEANHWYDSVHVVRQRAHGDWSHPLEEVFQRRLPALLRK